MTLTTRFARLRTDELRDGELIPVEIDGTPVVLVRHEGEFFAVQNNCSHKDFPLSEAGFDARDGFSSAPGTTAASTSAPERRSRRRPSRSRRSVRITDGSVEIGLTGPLAIG